MHFASLTRTLTYLESHLATWLFSHVALDTLSLTDLVLAGVILHARRVPHGTAEVAQYPNVFVHFVKMTENERVIKDSSGADRWPFVDVTITEPRQFVVS